MDDTYPALAEPQQLNDPHLAPRQNEATAGIRMNDTGGLQMAVMMSQQMAPRRPMAAIQQELKTLCQMYSDRYVYSWQVKDRKRGRMTTIEGPTVKLALDIARVYGKCWLGSTVRSLDSEHWIFEAIFVDLETGFTLKRDFVQRKFQDTGMADADRQADIVFQIGQSKAIRNVLVAAHGSLAAWCMEECKGALMDKVGRNQDRANTFIDGVLDSKGIAIELVEIVVGRKRPNWTLRDLTRVVGEMTAIADGFANADDLFPPKDITPQEEVAAEPAKVAAEKPKAKRGRKAKATETAPVAETEPQPAAAGATIHSDPDDNTVNIPVSELIDDENLLDFD